jgi:hypothetical protein
MWELYDMNVISIYIIYSIHAEYTEFVLIINTLIDFIFG